MSKKPVLVEVYSWNEPILIFHALAWTLFIVFFQFEPELGSGRNIVGIILSMAALVLATLRSHRLCIFLDYTLRTRMIRRAPKRLLPFLLAMWPTSSLLRICIHFFFLAWWILLAIAVMGTLDELNDVRMVDYLTVAFFHFDRMFRIVQGARR